MGISGQCFTKLNNNTASIIKSMIIGTADYRIWRGGVLYLLEFFWDSYNKPEVFARAYTCRRNQALKLSKASDFFQEN
jgi:hypothetical protein